MNRRRMKRRGQVRLLNHPSMNIGKERGAYIRRRPSGGADVNGN